MNRVWIVAAAMTSLMVLGCEDKTEAEKTADSAAKTATKKLEDAQEHSQAGTEAAKERAGEAEDAAKNRADAAESAAKKGAENIQSSIDDLVNKAQSAVKDGKWADADNYVKQIETIKGKLPDTARAKVDAALAEVKRAIDMGKKAPAMPGT